MYRVQIHTRTFQDCQANVHLSILNCKTVATKALRVGTLSFFSSTVFCVHFCLSLPLPPTSPPTYRIRGKIMCQPFSFFFFFLSRTSGCTGIEPAGEFSVQSTKGSQRPIHTLLQFSPSVCQCVSVTYCQGHYLLLKIGTSLNLY